MGVLGKLTKSNLSKNRRRTLVTIIGVGLSAALIFAIAGMVASFRQMMIDFTAEHDGNYHVMFEAVPRANLSDLTQNSKVESTFFTTADYDWSKTSYAPETFVHANSVIYPRAIYTEIMNVADLPADVDTFNVFVRFKSLKNYQATRDELKKLLAMHGAGDVNLRENRDLLRYEGLILGNGTLHGITALAIIVTVVVILVSIFVIRNSFAISANERAREFGMLTSVGATPRQIRRTVISEDLIIGSFGIVFGLALGLLADYALVYVINTLVGDFVEFGFVVKVSLPPIIFAITVLLEFGIVFCASLVPARRAAKRPAIEAIRSTNDVKINPKKVKTNRLVKRLFGVGGVIADKNLKRSKKKYRTTVISIVVSVASFVGLSSFMDYGERIIALEFPPDTPDVTAAIIGEDATDEVFQNLDKERFKIEKSDIQITDDYENPDGTGLHYYQVLYSAFTKNHAELTEYLRGIESINFVYDLAEEAGIMRNLYLLVEIFLYGFIAVVSLIGITNIFNTISTNVSLRAKEFAMLKSVGMTSSEFSQMVRLESLLYSIKSLLIGLPLGIGISWLVFKAFLNFGDEYTMTFLFPWKAILLAIVAVALLISIIMRYSVRVTNRQNIIETIREDNI